MYGCDDHRTGGPAPGGLPLAPAAETAGRGGASGRRQDSRRRLILALLITAFWLVVELAGGLYTHSLALLADAAHMLTDVAALALSLFAVTIASRPATHQKTFGYLRAEILAALANGVFLVLVALYIFYEAYQRVMEPREIRSGPMLAIAAVGLVANLATAGLLYRSHHDNLNIRGAFLHVAADTLGSVGTTLAGVVMVLWRWYLVDPIVSALVGLLVLYSSVRLVRDSVDVLLEGTPRHVSISEILADLGSVRGAVSVHDLHVWTISSDLPAMSCHVVIAAGTDPAAVLSEVNRLMREKHRIEHTTIQIEQGNWHLANVTARKSSLP